MGAIPGRGHGLAGGVVMHPLPTDSRHAGGEFYFLGGIAGTQWWIAPRHNLCRLIMTQRQMAFFIRPWARSSARCTTACWDNGRDDAVTTISRENGTGPGVLCLRSNAATSSQWRGLMDSLAGSYRVIAADSLGAGKSPPGRPVAGNPRRRSRPVAP